MTITINDTRNMQKTVKLNELEVGELYVNPYGRCVLFTDESCFVDMATGEQCSFTEYESSDEFIPIKARLEVYA